MEAWEGVQAGIVAVAMSPYAWSSILLGTVLGMIVGVLPGFGPPAAMALLFPLVYVLEPLPGMVMLAGIFYGAKYGGAVTSILVGIPGEADAVATMLEGRPLALAGRASAALKLAIMASFTGSLVAVLGLIALAPVLARLTLSFGAFGRMLLMTGALFLVAFFGEGSFRKGLSMVFLGFILAIPGLDPIHGVPRLTFGSWRLFGGIDLGALLLGLFGLGGILRAVLFPEKAAIAPLVSGELGTGPQSPFLAKAVPPLQAGRLVTPTLRGTAIGFFVGLVPSGAGVTASFASYALEKKLSREPQSFGCGQWAGLVGPEAANNAAAVASFAPLLLMGLPTNPVMAAMLGAVTVAGVAPGPFLPDNQPVLYWGFIFSLALGNALLLIMGLGLSRVWAALARVSDAMLRPVVFVLCLVGAWLGSGNLGGPLQCGLFGILSALLQRHGYPLSPLVLAFVLARPLETHVIQAVIAR